METFYSLAQQRRSTRKFKQEAVPVELQQKIQDIVLMSPASKRGNPWEFIFVENKETLEQLSVSKTMGAAFLKDAPFAVVVIADTSKSDVWIEDTSVTSTYLMLAAEDLGLGSCWIQIRNRKNETGENASNVIKRLLNIPEGFEVESIVAIGYKEEERKPFDLSRLQNEKIHKEIF